MNHTQSSQFQALFSPAVPHQASSVLLLIENSEAMANIWYDVRDQCLKPLLSEFDAANRNAPIKVFAVESLPLPPSPAHPEPALGSAEGLHHGLSNIRFNYSPNNRLSTAKVNAAIDLLSTVTYGGKPVTSHLVIVAATAPIDDPLLGIRQYAWFLLAEKLQKANIFCHLVLVRNTEDMSSLIGLYDKTRWLQGAVEVHPEIEALNHHRYQFRFAGRPNNIFLNNSYSYPGFPLALPGADSPASGAGSSGGAPVWSKGKQVHEFEGFGGEDQRFNVFKEGSTDPFFALPGLGGTGAFDMPSSPRSSTNQRQF
ncbi:hypothetical protein DFP72DRAFT_902246 [Ephemerocybe angulata]|uniref:Uncharacterized protein n=1 Tax=Ephemerocybe angulata TaxID=980116 RepID=A0A8H6HU17_9AGAR|nr:hypothetical protein DFP72DRAFT_902246 [Tulosesus angulatus]